MFDIGFLELVLVSIVGLLVLGPERLPGAIRTASLYLGKLRRSFNGIRAEIERELKADEIRQELHNQSIMQELRQTEQDLRKSMGVDESSMSEGSYPIEDPIRGKQTGDTRGPDSAETPASEPGGAASTPDSRQDESGQDESQGDTPAQQSAKS
jgi:sec-independent protein translocase protein TatB